MYDVKLQTMYKHKLQYELVLNTMTGITALLSYRLHDCTLSLFFKMMNSVKKINPYHLPTSPYDQLLGAHRLLFQIS
jgi:hypothetical protein